jgi:cystathionine beta-lyase/cystathionine gamma-synthase
VTSTPNFASGAFEGITYGREGTPTTRAFEEAITQLEGGYRAVTLPCGLGAIAFSLMAFLKAGDHLLMPDQLYAPARQFCDDVHDPDYGIWMRDFLGASGLFGFALKSYSDRAFAAFLDHMDLFKLGYSWGGYESLMVPGPRMTSVDSPHRANPAG